MSSLTANIVFATYQALSDGEKEAFLQLVAEKEDKKPVKKKKRERYSRLEAKFRPGNEYMLEAEILNM
tara:strand:+ start:3044 stop:3247 length:204 start_codon:yes stop_codon:yes gene_type:complete